jgi:hypothetical protein
MDRVRGFAVPKQNLNMQTDVQLAFPKRKTAQVQFKLARVSQKCHWVSAMVLLRGYQKKHEIQNMAVSMFLCFCFPKVARYTVCSRLGHII